MELTTDRNEIFFTVESLPQKHNQTEEITLTYLYICPKDENTESTESTAIKKKTEKFPLPKFRVAKKGRVHSKYSIDNVMARVKVFFINSLLHYINKLVPKVFGYHKFRMRKVIPSSLFLCKSISMTKEFFDLKVSKYFKQEISKKYIKTNPEQNILNIDKLNNFPFFHKFFDCTLFQIYTCLFVNNKGLGDLFSLDCLDNEKRVEVLSVKMKTLTDFVEKLKRRKGYDEIYISLIKEYSIHIQDKFYKQE
jgi:hypothetical protein